MRPLDGLAHLAAHKGGTVDAARRRPEPLRWIWYPFGGKRDKANRPGRMRHYMETYRANTLESNSARPNP